MIARRTIATILVSSLLLTCAGVKKSEIEREVHRSVYEMIIEQDSAWIMQTADTLLGKTPRHVTEAVCERSEGGPHDFYSEGDYWWPNPDDPEGPYIRRDGMSNPDNFLIHRKAMRDMSMTVATLTAAYKVSGATRYADEAIRHLNAWFIDPETRMNPNMAYAQAIKGRVPGRGVGLIDGIHLLEPAKAIMYLHEREQLSPEQFENYKSWFDAFLVFMTEHEYGIDERDRKNNHGTCWVLQAAVFARLTGNEEVLDYCRERYKTVLLPNQMSEDGSFHLELSRTKPYGYSLFNIDNMASVVHILSTEEDNLWEYSLEAGQGISKGMEFIVPYIADKSTWPHPQDVMYWAEWPKRHIALLFAGAALDEPDYLELWKRFPPLPDTQEGLRNFPLRMPVLWFD